MAAAASKPRILKEKKKCEKGKKVQFGVFYHTNNFERKKNYLKILSRLFCCKTETGSNSSHWKHSLPRVDYPGHPCNENGDDHDDDHQDHDDHHHDHHHDHKDDKGDDGGSKYF